VIIIVITKTSIYCGEDFYLNSETHLFHGNIPPVIGCLISDKDGKSIVSFEVFKGAIQFFMKNNPNYAREDKELQIDLIPMYVSAIELLSQELNIQGLPGIEINGINIKLKILFYFDEFTVTLFLNPKVNFTIIEDLTNTYLSNLFDEFKNELFNVIKKSSNDFITFLERVGLCWLIDLNNDYLALTQEKLY
jgi:hypothetical protein